MKRSDAQKNIILQKSDVRKGNLETLLATLISILAAFR